MAVLNGGIVPGDWETSRFLYWDIESLRDAFTLSVWDPSGGRVLVFWQSDVDGAADMMSSDALADRIRGANPSMLRQCPDVAIRCVDISSIGGALALARLMGVCTASEASVRGASPVNDPDAHTGDDLCAALKRATGDWGPATRAVESAAGLIAASRAAMAAGDEGRAARLEAAADDVIDAGGLDQSDLALPMQRAAVKESDSILAWMGVTPRTTPATDTDPTCDTAHGDPFLVGYNSDNYDTTMIAVWTARALGAFPDGVFAPPSCRDMRDVNDALFTPEWIDSMSRWPDSCEPLAARIRRNMLCMGRHIDAARLNEHQSRVGLKRLLGMMGYQVLESDRLSNEPHVDTADNLAELVAYNVSDCVGLGNLMRDPAFSANFDLKRSMMSTYPETVFMEPSRGANVPATGDRRRVSDFRLVPSSTSARFVATVLCPYGDKLDDLESVSFDYPAPDVATRRGVPMTNILEDTRAFFHSRVSDPGARARVDAILDWYKRFEGKNFDDSQRYHEHWDAIRRARGLEPLPVMNVRDIPPAPNCVPYYSSASGDTSSCFAAFSVGGLHGAEANMRLFDADMDAWRKGRDLMDAIRAACPDPLDAWKGVTLADGTSITRDKGRYVVHHADGTAVPFSQVYGAARDSYYGPKSTRKSLEARRDAVAAAADPESEAAAWDARGVGYRTPEPEPRLFKQADNGTLALDPRYAYTSVGPVVHEDFSSYYPNLLRNMAAFANPRLDGGRGGDRYADIFGMKQEYGRLMKDPSLDETTRRGYATLRAGTKLVLNSASGAGDSGFDSRVRMNNRILSMRLIGQMFTWRIGQAQALAGARIVSTNTDGLYSSTDDEALNNRILTQQAKAVNVLIEPEDLILVSKDSNNRIEIRPDGTIASASGGSLACWNGPTPTKSLAHPALVDRTLARILVCAGTGEPVYVNGVGCTVSLDEPLDPDVARSALMWVLGGLEPRERLRYAQNMVSCSRGTGTWVCGYPVDTNFEDATTGDFVPFQYYTRVLPVTPDAPGALYIKQAAARKVTARQKDTKDDERALAILTANGQDPHAMDGVRQAVFKDVPGFSGVPVVREARDLWCLPDGEARRLLSAIDMERFVMWVCASFDRNWRNAVPGGLA